MGCCFRWRGRGNEWTILEVVALQVFVCCEQYPTEKLVLELRIRYVHLGYPT